MLGQDPTGIIFKQMLAAELSSKGLPSTIEWIQSATVRISLCSTYLKHLCCQIYGLHRFTWFTCLKQMIAYATTWVMRRLNLNTDSFLSQIGTNCLYSVIPIIFHRSGLWGLFSVFQIVGPTTNPVLGRAHENSLVQAETHLEVDRWGSQMQSDICTDDWI